MFINEFRLNQIFSSFQFLLLLKLYFLLEDQGFTNHLQVFFFKSFELNSRFYHKSVILHKFCAVSKTQLKIRQI